MTETIANADHDPGHEHGHEHDAHDGPKLPVIAGYLLVLTIASFVTVPVQQNAPGLWGPITNVLFVLMIALCKASLVVGFFMHFRYEQSWKYFLTIPPLVLAVVAVCALLPDVAIGAYPQIPWVW